MQAFLDLGEILTPSDAGAALEAYRTVRACRLSDTLSCLFSSSLPMIPFTIYTILCICIFIGTESSKQSG